MPAPFAFRVSAGGYGNAFLFQFVSVNNLRRRGDHDKPEIIS
jgi:hypothetical protein